MYPLLNNAYTVPIVTFILSLGTWSEKSLPKEAGLFKSISNGRLGTWALDDAGKVFYQQDDEWKMSSTQPLEQISVGKNAVWGVSSDGGVWKSDESSGSMIWSKVDGNLKQISASDNGNVWGTSAGGKVMRREHEEWKPVAGGWSIKLFFPSCSCQIAAYLFH